jgi:alkylated DNA repair dioxygenase AlkB
MLYASALRAFELIEHMYNRLTLVEKLSHKEAVTKIYNDHKPLDGFSQRNIRRNLHNTIASLSFGAERKFSFKHKQTKQIVSLVLEHGSLLVMKGATQSNWLHSLPKSKNIT